ncbi:MAG: sulfotransferase, partial [Caldilineaceae bacterium]|nr:sulfotransferase [Caldilineaceae bacterium]
MWSFLGIGAQKAGTTWLYSQLERHLQLAFPLGKEAHFWDRPHNATAIAGYLSQFANNADVAGEMTPSYATLPISVVREIHACNPHLRLIYLIRNPIDRAWSSALMALQRAQMTLDEASDAWFSDHFHSAASRKRGDYQACLQTWREVFPKQQMLVLRFEQITNEPEVLINRCFQHLGVAPLDPEQLRQHGCREKIFAGP